MQVFSKKFSNESEPFVKTIAGVVGERGYKTGAKGKFSCLRGITVSSSGRIFICDGGDEDIVTGNHTIMVANDNGNIELICGSPGVSGFKDGVGSDAQFHWPLGIALSPDENSLFVADTDNHAIRTVSLANKRVKTLCGSTRGHNDGTLSSARFSSPVAVAIHADTGDIFVSDLGNRIIRRIIIETAVVITVAGMAGRDGHRDGASSESLLSRPKYFAMDRFSRNLYISDAECIRRLDLETNFLSTVCGNPFEAAYENASIGKNVRFDEPRGIAIDSANHLYVSDLFNDCVRVVDLKTGATKTLAGRPDADEGHKDGPGKRAQFDSPTGLAIHPITGDIYVNDYSNAVVRKILKAGTRPILYDQLRVTLRILRLARLLAGPRELSSSKRAIVTVLLDVMRGNFFDRQQLQDLIDFSINRSTLAQQDRFMQCFRGSFTRTQIPSSIPPVQWFRLKRKRQEMNDSIAEL